MLLLYSQIFISINNPHKSPANQALMNNQIRGEYILVNHELTLSSSFSQIVPTDGSRIYEVLRVIHGVCLFLEDHLERLSQSAKLANINLPVSAEELRNRLAGLVVINKITEGNFRLELLTRENKTMLAAWFIRHEYPTEDDYSAGVRLSLFKAERSNPNAKIVHTNLRDQITQFIAEKNIFEALLVNKEKNITEGSRSNFFLIRNNELFTAPTNEILEGITRKTLLRLCSQNHILFHEKSIKTDELPQFEAAFITGTSPKILPVCSIDKLNFNPQHPMLHHLMKLYNTAIDKYIKSQS
jgi:branched-chain amino acid aminotransferase